MTYQKTVAAIAAVSVLAAGTAVFAHDHKKGERHGPRMQFEEIDTNGDGKLSREEVQAIAAVRFAKHDTNGDGKITKEEAEAAGTERAGKRFEKMLSKKDADGDGALSMGEMKPKGDRVEKMFDKLDADGDGYISKDEAEKMRGHGKRHGKRKMKDGDDS